MKTENKFVLLCKNSYLLLFLRLFVGGVFIYASIDKIAHPAQFAHAIENYRILPHFLVNIFAIILPWVELVAGLLLISGVWSGASALIISGLLTMFIIAITAGLLRGLDISCGCFTTSGGENLGLSLILRDVILLLITTHILINSNSHIDQTS
ncbi:MAG: DoxX family membrane protein [Candidatus Omnitrophica bacterium]|nr:DoxX family membrane protein [Candidatus Omnitrophota bacterium]